MCKLETIQYRLHGIIFEHLFSVRRSANEYSPLVEQVEVPYQQVARAQEINGSVPPIVLVNKQKKSIKLQKQSESYINLQIQLKDYTLFIGDDGLSRDR